MFIIWVFHEIYGLLQLKIISQLLYKGLAFVDRKHIMNIHHYKYRPDIGDWSED